MKPHKVLITAALPYANGPLHFGHIAGAYLPSDCYARFCRLMKRDLLYLCGSDEYGIAVTMSAEIANRTPQQQVDLFHAINKKLFETLQISFDHYSRTTWEGHVPTAQQFFLELLHNGYIDERLCHQLFSEEENRFLADRYVTGECPRCGYSNARGDECPRCGTSYDATELKNPRSKLTNSPLVLRETKHWFLRLDLFKERLHCWLDGKAWKPNVLNFIREYIENMHPRSISRDLSWGVPLPLESAEGKVLYVWFDAPIGYISAAKEWASLQGTPERWRDYWLDSQTKLVQFVGKDNIPFHAAIFPAMIMGQNQPYKLVDELPANEFYHLEGRQFSKSEGWYIDLDDFFSRYSSDQIRYTIAANAPETADSEFTWDDFQQRCNGDLVGKYGNLANRVLTFIQNKLGGKIPPEGTLEDTDQRFLEHLATLRQEIRSAYENFKLRRATQLIMEYAQAGNGYFDEKKPWLDAKDANRLTRMQTTLRCCMECLKGLALISFPIIPSTATELWHLLGQASSLTDIGWKESEATHLAPGSVLPSPHILFRKIEDEEVAHEKHKLQSLRSS